jgi:hypothetical protein
MKKQLPLHLRILFEDESPTIGEMVERATRVFEAIDVKIEIASEHEVDAPLLRVLNVRSSCHGARVSADQTALFARRGKLGADDIVIFFVRETNPPLSGCAQHPRGQPGAVVTSQATRWSLAHEIGHVLGLIHVGDPKRVMHFDTSKISLNPPGFDASEIAKIKANRLLKP